MGFLFLTPNVLTVTRGAIKATGVNYGPVFQPASEAGGTVGSFVSTFAAMKAISPTPGKADPKGALMRRIFKI